MLIDIEKIKVSNRIRKDFGNIQELADDIKQNGLINPPVVTPDNFELIAGERRLRAMKLLGYKQVEVRPMSVKDAEHQLNLEISENETRKDFSKAERIDYARRLERIEAAKAKERQGERTDIVENFPQGSEIGKTRDIVADKLGIGSGKQYEREKYIVDHKDQLSPEDFAEWDESKLSTNKAYQRIKEKLKAKESEIATLKTNNNKDKNEIAELESQVSDLENQISELEDKLSKQKVVTREVKVIPADYDKIKDDLQQAKSQLGTSKTDYRFLQGQYNDKVKELAELKEKIRSEKEKEPEEQLAAKLKREALFFCAGVSSFVKDYGGYVWIAEHINELPGYEKRSYIHAVEHIRDWASTLLYNMENANNTREEEIENGTKRLECK